MRLARSILPCLPLANARRPVTLSADALGSETRPVLPSRDRQGAVAVALLLLVLPLMPAAAQTPPSLDRVLDRLDRLERQNLELLDEVRALRAELAASRPAPPGPPAEPAAAAVEQRLEIHENRIDELAQSKVETAQRFPLRLTGVVLFNAFLNARQSGGSDYPVVAVAPGPGHAGATLRQTILGLEFHGPETAWGGRVHASVFADFFTGTTTRDQAVRLRTASVGIDWKTRSVLVGLEKPIFNPREPSSLAQMGISPLTGTGNLWLWLPQARVEQQFAFGASSGLRARLGVVQTREVGPYSGSPPGSGVVEAARPGLEGRFEFFHKIDDRRFFEFAPGFHASTTHAGGVSVPSDLWSLDWFMNPWAPVELTGAFFSGRNVAHLGTGGLRQGYALYANGAEPVHSIGGWAQLTLHTLPRLDFHLFSGQHDDRNSDLTNGSVGKNLLFGGNAYFRLAPNVRLGVEASQLRTVYLGSGTRINNHYDVALGYLF